MSNRGLQVIKDRWGAAGERLIEGLMSEHLPNADGDPNDIDVQLCCEVHRRLKDLAGFKRFKPPSGEAKH
jgi:hypothetical protein